jgi:hypothetical protein
MDEKCVLGCDFNYKNKSEKTTNGFVCTPKICVDRMPWANRSCSMKEDFPAQGGSNVECFLSRVGDDGVETCVEKNGCPDGYPGVCFRVWIFYFFFFVIYLWLYCALLRFTMREVGKEI